MVLQRFVGIFKRPGAPRGSWDYYQDVRPPGPRRTATAAMICPGCGRTFGLPFHHISTNGAVSPSVVCPYCPFHQCVMLAGWAPPSS